MLNTKLGKCVVLFSLSLLINCVLVKAQSKVDKLETDKDIIKFVKNFFDGDESTDWRSFSLVSGQEWEDLYNINQSLKDSLIQKGGFQKWAREDYNQDKKMDLVVSGIVNDQGRRTYIILLFLSNEEGGYSSKNIIKQSDESYPTYLQNLEIPFKHVPGLRLISWAPNTNKISNNDYPFSVDTVAVVADEYIVNYNASPDSGTISKVDCNILNVDGTRDQLHIYNLDGEKNAAFRLVTFSGNDSTVIKGKMTPDIYVTLLVFLNYGGFMELPSHFLSNTPDPSTIFITKVEYSNGVSKRVEDNSGAGTYTLSSMYYWLQWLVDYSHNSVNMRKFERKTQPQQSFNSGFNDYNDF